MTVNEIALRLLRESIFGIESGASKLVMDVDVWNQVYEELKSQVVLGFISDAILEYHEAPEDIRKVWKANRYNYVWRYCQFAEVQAEACELLQKSGIEVAVIKGMAAAIYYPIPSVRGMGDIDLIVKPEKYKKAIKVLTDNNYIRHGSDEGRYHTAFSRNNIRIELHRSPAGIHRDRNGDKIRKYILSGIDSIEINQLGEKQFPILPWKQNGMELIWHIRQHLYSGLGIRQILDWMMFVNYKLDDDHMKYYMLDLKHCGLDQLAIVVTKMCQKYLGLTRENITWCESADEELCEYLINYIFEQGNFGSKAKDEKTLRVLRGYQNPVILFTKLQMIGEDSWNLPKKYPLFKPLAFIYGGVNELVKLIRREGGMIKAIISLHRGWKRTYMFSRLYSANKKNNNWNIGKKNKRNMS